MDKTCIATYFFLKCGILETINTLTIDDWKSIKWMQKQNSKVENWNKVSMWTVNQSNRIIWKNFMETLM